ncbi:MAG: oligosaccharide flippase family protein [Chloroflexi bacterium]|nr:oligosaccharide flippase family protein [Chloroflexota bacterium]
MARLIMPDEWGLFAEAIAVLSIAGIIRIAALDQQLVRTDDPPWGTAFLLQLMNGSVIYLALVAGADLFSFFSPELPTVLRFVALAGLVHTIALVPEAYMYRSLLLARGLPAVLGSALTNAVISMLLASQGWGVWSLVGGLIASQVVSAAALWWLFGPLIPLRFTLRGGVTLLARGRYLLLLALLAAAASQANVSILGILLSPEQVGLYSMAFALVGWPLRLLEQAFHNVAYPAFAQLRHDRPAMGRRFLAITQLVTAVETPLFIALFFSADAIVHFLLGDRWVSAVPFVRFLSLWAISDPVSMFGYEVLRSTSQDRALLAIQAIHYAYTTLAAFLFTLWLGGPGVVVGSIGVVGTVLMTHQMGETIPGLMQRLWRVVVPMYLLPFVVIGLAVWLAQGHPLVTAMASALGAGVCWATFYRWHFRGRLSQLLALIVPSTLRAALPARLTHPLGGP